MTTLLTIALIVGLLPVNAMALQYEDDLETFLNSNEEVSSDFMLQFQIVRTGEGSDKYDIEYTRSELGIADVLYNTGSSKKIKVIINQSGKKYTYTIGNNTEYIKFPLQLGNGSYTITIYENVTGSKYKKVYSNTDTINVYNTNLVYLNSIQIIDWEINDPVTLLMNQLIKEKKKQVYMAQNSVATVTDETYLDSVVLTKRQIIDLAYNYVIQNISYDYSKINSLPADYVPDPVATLYAKKGICYDYSSLLASMLRSHGIPVKLIKGYSSTTNVYHAWNEIYLTDEKRWIIVDTTYDAYMYQAGAQYKQEKALIDYSKNYEY